MHYFSYNENKKHGTINFPVAYYSIESGHSSYSMPLHWHKEWELIRVVDGEMDFIIDGDEYAAKKGDILLLRSGILHSATADSCHYECLDFDLHELVLNVLCVREPFRLFYRNIYLPRTYYTVEDEKISKIVDEIFSAFSEECSESVRRLCMLGNVSRLFAQILSSHEYVENSGSIPESHDKNNTLKRVLEYIEAHFSEEIKLSLLAEIAGMNPNYFCRFFWSFTQQTPMNYVNYYRIEQAANMLLATSLSVTDVAFRCGFNDTGYFIKAFKKQKGCTPKQFKNNIK